MNEQATGSGKPSGDWPRVLRERLQPLARTLLSRVQALGAEGPERAAAVAIADRLVRQVSALGDGGAPDLRRLTRQATAIRGTMETVLDDLADGDTMPVAEVVAVADEILSVLDDIDFAATGRAAQEPADAGPETQDGEGAGLRRRAVDASRILVTDDEDYNRDLLSFWLGREGYNVSTAANGREALDVLAREAIDLVLLDLMMPEVTGHEVLAHMQADSRLREIPVIVISAHHDIESVAACIEAGAEDFLGKPFNSVLLRARIGASLNKRRWRDRQRNCVNQLVAAMRRVEQSDLDVTLPVSGGDIYAELFRGFNLMVEGLQDEAMILDIARDLAGELQLDALLERIMRATTQILDADRSTLFVYDRRADELWSRVAEGMGTREIRLPTDAGIAGAVFTSGVAENVSDPYSHPRFNPEFDRQSGYRTESVLCMPIVNKAGECIGVTQVLNKRGGHFTARDEARLSAFAAQIAISLENAQLFDEVLNIKNYNESILRSTSNGLITLDTDRRVVTANESALAILQRDHDAVVGRRLAEVLGPTNAWVEDSVAKVEETSQVDISMDADLDLGGGDKAAVNLTAVPLIDISEEPIGSMVILEDITSEKRVKSTMARYMSKEVADQLLAAGEAELGGKDQNVSVLFSDVRNFTSLAENLGARGTVTMLNAYFEDMVDVVFAHGGILDKYIGDAIMAVFGAPFAGPEDADNAVAVANGMQVALRAFNARYGQPGRQPIEIGVGVATGEVVVGNLGSTKRMEYTVIGDSVNLASRLEGANKFYGTRVLLSEQTVRSLTRPAAVREIDLIAVRGQDRPVAVFQALGHHTAETFPNMDTVVAAYDAGLALYRRRDWRAAMDRFQAALDACPDDRPSRIHLDRCRLNMETPPPDDWDGVWRMTHK
ncbi:MAG: response regulator [Hyphomicrobiales bacterium]|nr:response regulator [Hyphomicrobiales bacterium]MCP5372403.1 response regulator [Hyphomicrobiales bacterium]